jgi:uncharacterized protein (TIGR03089 family)
VHQLSDSPEGLFAAIVAGQPSRPFVTYYDELSGERSELSAKSLANWVAKTYFLLSDELGLGVGDQAFIALPAHWISVPALLGSWTAGLSLSRDSGSAQVGFVEPVTVESASGIPDVYAIAPTAAARGFEGVPGHGSIGRAPAGSTDFVAAVRPQPDAWTSVHAPAGPDDPGIGARTRSELVAEARQRAADLGLAPGARLLSTRVWREPGDWIDTLLVPLVLGGSVVIVANADDDTIERRLNQERAVRLSD